MASRGYRSCRTYTDEVRQSAVAMVQAGQVAAMLRGST